MQNPADPAITEDPGGLDPYVDPDQPDEDGDEDKEPSRLRATLSEILRKTAVTAATVASVVIAAAAITADWPPARHIAAPLLVTGLAVWAVSPVALVIGFRIRPVPTRPQAVADLDRRIAALRAQRAALGEEDLVRRAAATVPGITLLGRPAGRRPSPHQRPATMPAGGAR